MLFLRRAKKSPSRGRRRLSVRFLTVARWGFAAGVALAAVLLVRWAHGKVQASEAFALSEVRIEGGRHLDSGALSGLILEAFPRQLLAIDLNRVRDLVEAENWVLRATVRRKMPASLVIHVEEREPVAVAAIDSSLFVVDSQGVVLDGYGDTYPDLSGPIVRGLRSLARENAAVENRLRMELYLSMVAALDGAGHLTRISEIDVGDPGRVAFVPSDEPVPVIVGDRNHVARYEAFLSQLDLYRKLKQERGEIESVDVTYEGKIIFHTADGGGGRLAAATSSSS